MSTIRTKIYGITRPEDALAAAESGTDTVGLVLYARSKRTVSTEQAQVVVKSLPPFVLVVVLFMSGDEQAIYEILHQVPTDVIQLRGGKDDNFCRRFNRSYLKVVCIRSAADIQTACVKFPNTRALLFDTHHPIEYDGMGRSFDQTMSHGNIGKPQILAGGLTAEDAAEMVKISGAATVDVSGGMETSGGVKSREKMAALIQAVKVV